MVKNSGSTFFAAVVVAYVIALAVAALVMPDPVPSHYDGLGRPDDWASRTAMVLFWALMGAFILGCGWGLSRIRMKEPTYVNLPRASKEYWFASDERRATFWGIFAHGTLTIVGWTGLYLAVLIVGTAFAARSGADLPPVLLYGSLVAYLVAVGWTCVRLLQRTRPPRG